MTVGKILASAVLVVVGLWLILPVAWLSTAGLCFGVCPGLWYELWFVIKGIVPIVLILIGAMLIYIEVEELKFRLPKKRK
jgi:hypothetical protein